MKTRREIEEYLWSKRLSQNYKGFSFLVDALLLAEEEVPVNHALLVRIAEEHQTTAARVHSLLRTVLHQIRLMGASRMSCILSAGKAPILRSIIFTRSWTITDADHKTPPPSPGRGRCAGLKG